MGLKASLGYLVSKGTSGGTPNVKPPSNDASGQAGGSTLATNLPNVKYPGNDPTVPPGEGFVWKGKGEKGSRQGSWYNPTTEEMWRTDLHHPPPIEPHWDYFDADDNGFRVYDDDRVEPK